MICAQINQALQCARTTHHLTSKPRTPSISPTVFARTPHIFRNAPCRYAWIGTSPSAVFTRNFGANVSPAQKHVLRVRHQIQQMPRVQGKTLTPWSQQQASDIRMATSLARLPYVRRLGHLSATLRPDLPVRAGRSQPPQGSTQGHPSRRYSATRRPDAVPQKQSFHISGAEREAL